ncbi:MAG: type II toxin-antitoxin system VapC family toxin [Anaerolineales bacterium]
MNFPLTIDASVFISAFTPSEQAHEASKAFMHKVRETNVSILVPTLLIPEIAAAIGRGQGKPDLGYAFAIEVSCYSNVTLISLDENLAEMAAEIAARYRLRGSDAVYAAVARRFAATLVTLDTEQLERLQPVVPARMP